MQLSRSHAVLGVPCLIALATVACGDGLILKPAPDGGVSSDAPFANDAAEADAPGPDAPSGPDAPGLAEGIIRVANTGNDLNDGFLASVATLQRAIAIASANPRVTGISFAAGRYVSATPTTTGERFPYTVPDSLTLSGPAGGGAILIGPRNLPGLFIAKGTVRDLEFENFTTAITASGEVRLENLRVRTSETAIAGKDAAQLIVDNLDVDGADACATGIALNGTADLVATTFVGRELGFAVKIHDDSAAQITAATLQGDPLCMGSALLELFTSKTLELRNSSLTHSPAGIEILRAAEVTIVDTTVSDTSDGVVGATARLEMTRGELSGNATGAFGIGGAWSFTGVVIKDNRASGVSMAAISTMPPRLTMRGCQVTGNRANGIEIIDFDDVDLGTPEQPGNNTIKINKVGLSIGGANPGQIDAVGNHWTPGVQEANDAGDYPEVKIIQGPLRDDDVASANFSIDGVLGEEPWRVRR
jgi:hypothetical protein